MLIECRSCGCGKRQATRRRFGKASSLWLALAPALIFLPPSPFSLHLPLPFSTIGAKMSSHGAHSSSPNLVGVHYRVGKKIGEGSFGVIFEGPPSFLLYHLPATQHLKCHATKLADAFAHTGTNLLNSQTVAIKFVRGARLRCRLLPVLCEHPHSPFMRATVWRGSENQTRLTSFPYRNLGNRMRRN